VFFISKRWKNHADQLNNERTFDKKKHHRLQIKFITDRIIADNKAEKIRENGGCARVITGQHNKEPYYKIYYRYDLRKLNHKQKKKANKLMKKKL